MRMLLSLFLALAALPAWAQSADEKAYLAERNRAIATLEAKYDDAAHKRLAAALEARLRRLLGPVATPAGFTGPGTYSPEPLCCGVGSGRLDGIGFSTERAMTVVSSEGLLRAWLVAQKLPAEPQDAFRTGDFYTIAVVGDAAVSIFAALPIARPAGATAAAVSLVLVSQAGAFTPPTHITVALLKDGRAQAALVEATTKPQPIAACDAELKEFQAKAKAAYAAKKPDDAIAAEEQGEKAYLKCWAARAPGETWFAAQTRQGQALLDSLAR